MPVRVGSLQLQGIFKLLRLHNKCINLGLTSMWVESQITLEKAHESAHVSLHSTPSSTSVSDPYFVYSDYLPSLPAFLLR